MEEKVIIHTAISTIFNDVRNIIENGLRKAYQNANTVTVLTYWQVGRRIVEEEQQGERRAEYGAQIINLLSAELCKTYAKGYSPRDLRAYRQFYLCFNDLEIWYSRVPNLTWTHFRTCYLSRVTMPVIGLYRKNCKEKLRSKRPFMNYKAVRTVFLPHRMEIRRKLNICSSAIRLGNSL